MVQVFAHVVDDGDIVKALARDYDERAKSRGSRELENAVERGSALTFVLSMPGVEIDNSTQRMIWRGHTLLFPTRPRTVRRS
jgi:hypothetical protein